MFDVQLVRCVIQAISADSLILNKPCHFGVVSYEGSKVLGSKWTKLIEFIRLIGFAELILSTIQPFNHQSLTSDFYTRAAVLHPILATRMAGLQKAGARRPSGSAGNPGV
jgi:hypothetical protein